MPQTALDEVEHRAVSTSILLFKQLARDANQQAVGVGRFQRVARELAHEFSHGQAVRFADVVQQAKRMVLDLFEKRSGIG